LLLYDAFPKITEALRNKGIQPVALKGIYLAEHLYPKIGLRQFSDIDLLFRIEDAEKALEVFTRLGFSMVKPAFGEMCSNATVVSNTLKNRPFKKQCKITKKSEWSAR
jgi:hypothetical protein